MRTDTGIVLEGKFTTVNGVGLASDGVTYTSFNAQFEVKGNGVKFVGTLDSTGVQRVLDGVWVSGSTTWDVSGNSAF